MAMKSEKVWLCALLFMAVTGAKLFYPETARELRRSAGELLTRGVDYRETLETMGRELSERGLGRELIAALAGETPGRESVSGTAGPPEQPAALPAMKENSVTDETEEEPVPEAVSAFLAAQAQFAGYELPQNVRADMPQIPFVYASPVTGYNSSGFGYRVHPIEGIVKFHYGTDFAANEGEDVTAFADGSVSAAGTSAGYGNYLIISHEGGFSTLYAHMSRLLAEEGETVARGQTIGLVGHTGNATGPHLHFELQLDSVYLNPEYYV